MTETEAEPRPCVMGPCDPAPTGMTRSLAQPLHAAVGARCPVCRNAITRAEVVLHQRWQPARWWQRLDMTLRWQRWVLGTELGYWEDTRRSAVFSTCECEWSEDHNPLTDLVVLMRPCGAAFAVEPREYSRGPHVQVRPAPPGSCDCEECDR